MRIPLHSGPHGSDDGLDDIPGVQPDRVFAIDADLLIPGRGEPIRDATVVVMDDKIHWFGRSADVPAAYSAAPKFHVPVLMPGMWDAHTHFMGTDVAIGGIGSSSGSELLPGTQALIGAVLVADLQATLMAGFTSVRELGGYAGYLAPGIEKGALVGPSVYSALGVLSITGGHGDQHDLPLSTVVDACKHGTPYAVCDGADECTKMVRKSRSRYRHE